ncbi:hypothetical protein HNR65_003424 [Desulfosalsimonas propionicica]|uniref:Uncharacterized protein n=1 Tax=Desulfosalsimonas propionicica TaxID=332175 RepID=A0A7W0HM98_9BACT|nr:hypothetical protein [Desulfosalsimonas propionicica]MBA2883067.1 hypothetical protein [Desulfosalsimonas propionicica]
MALKRKPRTRQAMPDHVRRLFLIGSGCNTQYTPQEIRELWQKYGRQFLQSLPPYDERQSEFQRKPMIFNLLGTTEEREWKKLNA